MTKQFIPPTLEEVRQVIQEKGYSIGAEVFFYFYASKDWMVGKNKMQEWKMALAGWDVRNKKKSAKTKLFPISGKTCGKQGCQLPAVYKSTSGAYDHFSCFKHMPESVKQEYC